MSAVNFTRFFLFFIFLFIFLFMKLLLHTYIHSMDTHNSYLQLISSAPYYRVKTESLCLKEDREEDDTTSSGKKFQCDTVLGKKEFK